MARAKKNPIAPTLHGDGTVTYWSVYGREWRTRVLHIPDEELAAMSPESRARVVRVLGGPHA